MTLWRGAGVLRRPLGRPGPALEGFGGLADVPASAARRLKSRRTRPGLSLPRLRARSQRWRWSSAMGRARRSWVMAAMVGSDRGALPGLLPVGFRVPLVDPVLAATRHPAQQVKLRHAQVTSQTSHLRPQPSRSSGPPRLPSAKSGSHPNDGKNEKSLPRDQCPPGHGSAQEWAGLMLAGLTPGNPRLRSEGAWVPPSAEAIGNPASLRFHRSN